ncbi:helix-turn-helix domain-containing protein [Phenylobacterium ferrooxidans]|uniref:Helix-turn-helix domain-containing protein n=1 Tax=Phenylobacterium ferrooxidans TaxID=2982689 RepID=A0ABW6CKK1_9CAUL
MAHEAGLDRTYVSGMERQIRHPTITSVEKVATALGVTFGQLLD